MSSAADLITLALKDIQVLDESETPSAYLMADALTTLNQMMSLWSVSDNYVHAELDLTFAPTGAASYTIGTSGADVIAANPNAILYAFLRKSNIDYPIAILNTFEEYQSIPYKTVSTFPSYLYYNPTYPLGTIYLYPQPDAADGTMHLGVNAEFPIYSVAASSINLPLQYDMAIRFGLAEYLAIMMGRVPRPDINMMAKRALKMLKNNNLKIQELSTSGDYEDSLTRITRGF